MTAISVITRRPIGAADIATHEHVEFVVLVMIRSARSCARGEMIPIIIREAIAVRFEKAIALVHHHVDQTWLRSQISGRVEGKAARRAAYLQRIWSVS